MVFLSLLDLLNRGEYDKANSWIVQNYNGNFLLLLQGLVLFKQQDYSEVLTKIDTIKANTVDEKFCTLVLRAQVFSQLHDNTSVNKLIEKLSLIDLSKLTDISMVKYFIYFYYNLLGNFYWIKGELQLAKENHEKCFEFGNEIGDIHVQASAINNIGLIYIYQNLLDEALEQYQESIELLKPHIENSTRAQELNNNAMGNSAFIYGKKGRKEDALKIHFEILDICISTSNTICMMKSYLNIGSLYSDLRQYKKAMEFLKKGLHLAEKIDDKRYIAGVNSAIGEAYFDQGDLNEAIPFFKTGLELVMQNEDIAQITKLMSQLGKIYTLQVDLNNAEKYFEEILELSGNEKRFFDPTMIAMSYYFLGLIEIIRGNYKTGEKSWIKRLETHKKNGINQHIMEALFSLVLLFIDSEEDQKIELFFNEIVECNEIEKSEESEKIYLITKAMISKYKGGVENIEIAKKVFKKFIPIDPNNRENYSELERILIYNLIEANILLLLEDPIEGLIDEARELINQLIVHAKNQYLQYSLIDNLILKSKLELLQSDFNQINSDLMEALTIAKTYGLKHYEKRVREEIAIVAGGESKFLKSKKNYDKLVAESGILLFLRSKGGSRGALPDY